MITRLNDLLPLHPIDFIEEFNLTLMIAKISFSARGVLNWFIWDGRGQFCLVDYRWETSWSREPNCSRDGVIARENLLEAPAWAFISVKRENSEIPSLFISESIGEYLMSLAERFQRSTQDIYAFLVWIPLFHQLRMKILSPKCSNPLPVVTGREVDAKNKFTIGQTSSFDGIRNIG